MSEASLPEQPKSKSKGLQSLVFALVMAAVIGVFAYLSSLAAPTNLPADSVHRFRFDTHGRLVGLAAEAPGEPFIVEHVDFKLDKKAIEARINETCASCHGKPNIPLSSHACATSATPCVPAQHPPKTTCIKCHRHGSE